MADFEKAFNLMKEWENRKTDKGIIIYSNDKIDKGGETVSGISRNYHKNFAGWKIVDEAKEKLKKENKMNALNISKLLLDNEELNILVKDFYKKNFWDIMKCDLINSQAFAENIFLLGVNAGIITAVKVAQKSGGLVADGIIGKKTLELYKKAGREEVVLFTAIEIEYYKSIVNRDRTQERFLKGWIKRAEAI